MNAIENAQRNSIAAGRWNGAGRRAIALAVALATQLALPATAGDTGSRTTKVAPRSVATSAVRPGAKHRFAFTGMYRFATPHQTARQFNIPRLTTGSLPPAPVKPNDPPTGSLGGPAPTTAAPSVHAKSTRPPADRLNRRDLTAVVGSPAPSGPVVSRLKRISRAQISSVTPARISEPLPSPEKLQPAQQGPSKAQKTISTKPKRTGRSTKSRRTYRYRKLSASQAKRPKWWEKAWHHDGPL